MHITISMLAISSRHASANPQALRGMKADGGSMLAQIAR
jgi:hypothetical protein